MCRKISTGSSLGKSIGRLLAVLFFIVVSAGSGSAGQRHHDSHVHGIGKLNVALDGNVLIAELGSPAANIVGFEHAPENEQQEHALHEKTEQLADGSKLFVLPAAAKCSLKDVQLSNGMEEHHDDSHGHDEGPEHNDFTATYLFECAAPQNLSSIDVRLFEYFPGFDEIDVQLIAPGKQTAIELTAKNNLISF